MSREVKCVQEKVNHWNSTGRLKKAFLASEHAEELNGYQDKVQTTLEELQVSGCAVVGMLAYAFYEQLLVSLKTSDLVVEISTFLVPCGVGRFSRASFRQ